VTTSLGMARNLASVGNFGWGGAAKTMFVIDPSEAMILLMMTQHLPVDPYPLSERFQTLAYQAIND
jgi:CubicO group peptidase (beta-lactamase class C family)